MLNSSFGSQEEELRLQLLKRGKLNYHLVGEPVPVEPIGELESNIRIILETGRTGINQ